ncbi:transposase [Roseibacillus persicicus]|nr:transposase [Roseibacillus persicicus]
MNCNLALLKSLSLLTTAILQHRTVNLAVLATTADGKDCSNESRYRRFQDFFLNFTLCLPSLGKFLLDRIPKPFSGYILAMDRTNWQFGQRDINFLTIAIVAGKVSIPVVWKVLPASTRRGNSNTAQRVALTKTLLALLPASNIQVLTMDREFVSKKWLSWLDEQGVGYIVRIKKNAVVGKRLASEHAVSRGRKPT